ncbi:Hypothetical predicted protein [Olea europaea subsp. europaea]|uniref:Uncharacterized protein n=1 Tax=Olea europaea subsp. europaea TaxID=158383 RepID=A0A8S0P9U1_OLEEU|nr:Hypothetical predicted protein [Olea europaea subsp. europaea]
MAVKLPDLKFKKVISGESNKDDKNDNGNKLNIPLEKLNLGPKKKLLMLCLDAGITEDSFDVKAESNEKAAIWNDEATAGKDLWANEFWGRKCSSATQQQHNSNISNSNNQQQQNQLQQQLGQMNSNNLSWTTLMGQTGHLPMLSGQPAGCSGCSTV